MGSIENGEPVAPNVALAEKMGSAGVSGVAVDVWKHQMQARQAWALEGAPCRARAMGLVQTVGNGPPGARVHPDAEMAGHYLNVFRVRVVRCRGLNTAPPSDDAPSVRE